MRIPSRLALAAATPAVLLFSTCFSGATDLPTPVFEERFEPAAPPFAGFYASLHGGLLLANSTTVDFELAGEEPRGTANNAYGYRVGGAVGYDFNANLGTEVEVSYASASVDSIDVGPPFNVNVPTDGSGSALTIMGNVILGEHFGPWRPYVGAGGGAGYITLDNDFGSGLHDSDWTWVAQAFAGIDLDLTENVSLGARYRYQYFGPTNYSDGNGLPVGLHAFGLQSVEALLKVRFGG